MAKKKPSNPPSQPEPAVSPAPAEPVGEQDAALQEVGIKLPEEKRVYSVEIPRCLLGERFFQAVSEQKALEQYKGLCGITSHREPARIRATNIDPKRVDQHGNLLGEPGDTAG